MVKRKGKEIFFWYNPLSYKTKKLIEILNRYNHKHILEIGSGLTPFFPNIDRFESYTIVEPSKVFCDIANELITGELCNKNITIINGFIENIYIELYKFDFIFLSGVLHLAPNPNEILQAVHKLCHENTVFHVNVTNVYSLHNILGYEIGLIKNLFEQSETGIIYERNTRFDKKRLISFMEENGFEVIDSGTYIIKPFTNTQMEQMLEYNIIDEKVIEGLEKLIEYLPDFGAEVYVNVKKKNFWI